jgi:hypothetical protein
VRGRHYLNIAVVDNHMVKLGGVCEKGLRIVVHIFRWDVSRLPSSVGGTKDR